MASQGGKDAVLEALAAQPERLEAGMALVDRRLTLEAGVEIDLLLRDALGGPVLVLGSSGEVGGDVARLMGLVAALARARPLLDRFYRERGLDLSLRPRAVLVATRFADDVSLKLDLLGALEVQALEARTLAADDGRLLLDLSLVHRTRGVPPEAGRTPGAAAVPRPQAPARAAAAPAAPAPAAAAVPPPRAHDGGHSHAGPGTPDGARSLYLRARESIRSLAPEVTENSENGGVRFRVDGRSLAALSLDQHGFTMRVGDDEAEAVPVEDEAAFNDRLNAVFDLYFTALGPELPGA